MGHFFALLFTLFVQLGNVALTCILLLLICVLLRSRLLFSPVWLLMWLCQLLDFLQMFFFTRIWSNKMFSRMEREIKIFKPVRMFVMCENDPNFEENQKFIIFSALARHSNLSFFFSAIFFFFFIWYAHFLIFCTGKSRYEKKTRDAFPLVRIFPVYSTPIWLVDKSQETSAEEQQRKRK